MSSYYTDARLEQERQEALRESLRQEIRRSVEKLRAQLVRVQTSGMQAAAGGVVIRGDAPAVPEATGYLDSAGMAQPTVDADRREVRDEMDLSVLMQVPQSGPDAQMELARCVDRMGERAILTKKDYEDWQRVSANVARLAADETLSPEERIQEVRMRVDSYLQGGAALTPADAARIEERYLEYRVLCDALELEPRQTIPYLVAEETERLQRVLERRRQDEYIMEKLDQVMEDMGFRMEDEAILDGQRGQLYSVDGKPLCQVFVARQGEGVLFDPVADMNGASLDRQRQIVAGANEICEKYAELERRMADAGIVLDRRYLQNADMGNIYAAEEICLVGPSRKHRAASGGREKAMEMGE